MIPAHDDCANALTALEGSTIVNNTFATTDGGDGCPDQDGFFALGRDVWCTFTPTVTAAYNISTGYDADGLASPIDYLGVALFASCADAAPPAPTPIACSAEGFSYTYFRASLTAGVPYTIRIAGLGWPVDNNPFGRGDVKLKIERVVPPSNDQCDSATAVGAGEFPFDLRFAAADGARACMGPDAPPLPDLWYLYTPAFTGFAEIGLVGESPLAFPSTLRVTVGEVTTGAECDGDAPTNAAGVGSFPFVDPDFGTFYGDASRLIFQATSGQSVRIRVAAAVPDAPFAWNGKRYTGPVRTPVPPANDACGDATTVTYQSAVPFSTVGSTRTADPCYAWTNCFGDSPDPCTQAITDDVFFRFVAPSNGTADIRVSDGAPHPDSGAVIAVLDACSTLPVHGALECGDAPGDALRFPMVAGQMYIIRLGTYIGSVTTSGTLTITCPADFNGAGGVSVQDIFDFLGAYFGGC